MSVVPIKDSPKKSKGEKKKSSNVEIRGTVKQKLPVTINEDAVRKKEARIRKALTEKVLVQEEIKPFSQKLKALTEEVETLRAEAESYTEVREVKCQVEFDHARREVRYRRMDTNKIVDSLSRTMTDEDADLPKGTSEKTSKGAGKLTPAEAIAKAREQDGTVLAGKAGRLHRLPNPVLSEEAAKAIGQEADEEPLDNGDQSVADDE